MKLFLRPVILIAAFLITFNQVKSQCTVTDFIIQNIQPSSTSAPGTCTVTFDLSFTMENNNGNKYIFLHAWLDNGTGSYPNYFQCVNNQSSMNGAIRAPKAADLGNQLITLGINNSGATPVFLTSYTPDPTVPINAFATFTTAVGPNNTTIYIFEDVTATFPVACGSPTIIVADVWSSQSANASQAHCVSCNHRFAEGFVSVAGIINCQLRYQGLVTKNVAQPLSFTYEVYADVNGDGNFSPTVDTAISAVVAFSIGAGVGMTYNFGGDIPAANLNQDLFVVVTQTSSGFANSSAKVEILVSPACGTLPVTFRTFTANRSNRSSVALRWETSTEINNSGFSIQRNKGNTWEQVQFVASQATGGNSNSVLTYNFVDQNSHAGITQYRIKQVDRDGRAKYSEVRAVRGEGQNIKMIVYPNPSADGRFNLLFEDKDGTRDVSLMDMSGRVIKQWIGVTGNTVQVENVRPGMYSIRVVIRETGAQSFEKVLVK